MSLIQKYSPYHFHSKKIHPNPSPKPKPFDDALIRRLAVLRASLDKSSPSVSVSVSVSFLLQAVNLLNSTLLSASKLLSDPTLAKPEPESASAHLDASVALLDSLNLLTSRIDHLSRLRLHVTFALRVSSAGKARESLAEWRLHLRKPLAGFSPSDLVKDGPPRGKISAVRRAIYAVEAVSALVVGAALSFVAGADFKADLLEIRAPEEFSWSNEFNGLLTAVCGKVGGFAAEVEAVDAIVKELTAAVSSNGEMTVHMKEEAEKKTEELMEGLDRLGAAVDGAFRTALSTRDVVLNGFRVTSSKCK